MSAALNKDQDLLGRIEELSDKISQVKDFMEVQDRKLVVTGEKAETELAYKAYAAAATELYEMRVHEDKLKRNGEESELDEIEQIALDKAFANMQNIKKNLIEPYRELRRNNGVVANTSEPLTDEQQKKFEVVKKAIGSLNSNPFRQEVVRELILDFGSIIQGSGNKKKRVGQEIAHTHPAKTELWYRYSEKIVSVLEQQIRQYEEEIEAAEEANSVEKAVKNLEMLKNLHTEKLQALETKESELLRNGIIPSELS